MLVCRDEKKWNEAYLKISNADVVSIIDLGIDTQ